MLGSVLLPAVPFVLLLPRVGDSPPLLVLAAAVYILLGFVLPLGAARVAAAYD